MEGSGISFAFGNIGRHINRLHRELERGAHQHTIGDPTHIDPASFNKPTTQPTKKGTYFAMDHDYHHEITPLQVITGPTDRGTKKLPDFSPQRRRKSLARSLTLMSRLGKMLGKKDI